MSKYEGTELFVFSGDADYINVNVFYDDVNTSFKLFRHHASHCVFQHTELHQLGRPMGNGCQR
jgi:hypothetical protein